MSAQTSVTTLKNETERYPYPAITFCQKFKMGARIFSNIIHPGFAARYL